MADLVGELRVRGAVVGWFLLYGVAQLVVALQLDVGGTDLVPALVWGPVVGIIVWVVVRRGGEGRFLAQRVTPPVLAGGLGVLAVVLLLLGWETRLQPGNVLRSASQCLCIAVVVALAPRPEDEGGLVP